MKTKFFGILMVAMLVLQSITFTSVFASESATNRVAVDFSDTNATYNVTNTIDGVFDYQIVKGQYGKAANDASIRLYSLGGEDADLEKTRALTIDTSSVPAATAGSKYTHISFQFLNEDGYSTIEMKINGVSSDGTVQNSKQLFYQPRTDKPAEAQQNRVLHGASASNRRYNAAYGTWCQLDVYFDLESAAVTTFFNGTKSDVNGSGWAATMIKQVKKITINHAIKSASPYKATAVQLDNIVVENVDSIPTSQDYRYLGESFDFDNDMSISDEGKYMTKYWYEDGSYTDVEWKGNVTFKSKTTASTETGIFGKPSYDHSLRTVASGTSEVYNMTYTPGVSDLALGDYAHLTFAVANSSADSMLGVNCVNPYNGATNLKINQPLLRMPADCGEMVLFGENTGKSWEVGKWYKIDSVIKIGDATTAKHKVAGYINGEKIFDDIEWDIAAFTKIGTISFMDDKNSDYYIDDVAFGVFDADSFHNPEAGYTLTSAKADLSVDDGDAIIGLADDTDIAFTAYSDLFTNADNALICNSAGAIVYKGTLDSDSWVKASNGFGGGVYYNVGYKYDKLAIGDIAFDSAGQKLTSQAEIGFGINEAKGVVADEAPTAGVVIIALYEGTELVGISTASYTSLTSPATVAINNVASVDGKTAKVFIFNSLNNGTPLIVNEVKSDF